MGNPQESKDFFASIWPEARVISDQDRSLYRGFGLKRGGLAQMFSPQVFACGFRAVKKGYGVGKPIGDPWQMPAYVLIRDRSIVWRYDPKHAGDHPDFAAIAKHVSEQ
jgi:hypothetical protein